MIEDNIDSVIEYNLIFIMKNGCAKFIYFCQE